MGLAAHWTGFVTGVFGIVVLAGMALYPAAESNWLIILPDDQGNHMPAPIDQPNALPIAKIMALSDTVVALQSATRIIIKPALSTTPADYIAAGALLVVNGDDILGCSPKNIKEGRGYAAFASRKKL